MAILRDEGAKWQTLIGQYEAGRNLLAGDAAMAAVVTQVRLI